MKYKLTEYICTHTYNILMSFSKLTSFKTGNLARLLQPKNAIQYNTTCILLYKMNTS